MMQRTAAFKMVSTGPDIAAATSERDSTTVRGMPFPTSRPVTSIFRSSAGQALPIVRFIASDMADGMTRSKDV